MGVGSAVVLLSLGLRRQGMRPWQQPRLSGSTASHRSAAGTRAREAAGSQAEEAGADLCMGEVRYLPRPTASRLPRSEKGMCRRLPGLSDRGPGPASSQDAEARGLVSAAGRGRVSSNQAPGAGDLVN